jgi:Nitrile hydratase beta subunit
VPEPFTIGARVQTGRVDPPHHTRLPRYARGAVGTLIECEGTYQRPDDRSRGFNPVAEPVYTVRFVAGDLFGEGEHTVTIALWQSYMSPLDEDRR